MHGEVDIWLFGMELQGCDGGIDGVNAALHS
jgi:hypothetical protein